MLPPHGGRKYFLSPKGMMAIEGPQNEEIYEGGKNEEKKESVLLSVGEE